MISLGIVPISLLVPLLQFKSFW